jgi:hypothetical protein
MKRSTMDGPSFTIRVRIYRAGLGVDIYAMLSAEARQLHESYATVSRQSLAGQEPFALNPTLQGRDRNLAAMGNLCSGQA